MFESKPIITGKSSGGEFSTIVSQGRDGVFMVETLFFHKDGSSSRAVRSVVPLREIIERHMQEIRERWER